MIAVHLNPMDRVGLLGGTFNPIHFGHLRTALEVKEMFDLTRIILIPSAVPPHKSAQGVVSAEDRLEMVRMAVADAPGFEISEVELERSGPSYSVDTLDHFRSALPEGARLFFIVGLDAFLEIDTWDRYSALFQKAPFIVMARPGAGDPADPEGLRTLQGFLSARVSDRYGRFNESGLPPHFVHPEKEPVYTATVSGLDISSTRIRRLLRQGRSIRFLVPDPVAAFIHTKGLYA